MTLRSAGTFAHGCPLRRFEYDPKLFGEVFGHGAFSLTAFPRSIFRLLLAAPAFPSRV